jgi:xanthine dehydrogenase YagT iron-sulfur-binding subunit
MSKEKKDDQGKSGFLRRDFLRGGAASSFSGGLLSGGLVGATSETAAEAEILGPAAVPVTLKINGKTYRRNLEPRVTLLDALRNHLDLTGAKKVCDRASCGACTVILEGKTIYACSVLAIDVQGKQIQTIEGLGSIDQLHPVQAAFVENDAQQCGFCTPGFVMACKAFLDQQPNPTLDDIGTGLGGNVCRCGTYVGIRQTVFDLARAGKGEKSDA